MSVTQSFWAQVPGSTAQAPPSDASDFWTKARAAAAPAAPKPGFGTGFKETFAPTAIGGQLIQGVKQMGKDVTGGPQGWLNLAEGSLPSSMRALIPSTSEMQEAARTGQNPEVLRTKDILSSAKNLWQNRGEIAKEAGQAETGPRIAGQAVGTAANFLLPGIGEEAPEAEGESALARAASRIKLPAILRPVVRGLSTTPEKLANEASGRLMASAENRQGMIEDALSKAKQNTAPLYENLHAADEADNPGGAIQLPEEVAKAAPQPETKAPRLTIGEAQDLDMRTAAGKNAPTRRQSAASFAAKQLASGMKDSDVRQVLRNQFGFSSNQVANVMNDATAPSESGTYTLAQVRAIRGQIGRSLGKAENAAQPNFQDVANLEKAYGAATDAMRGRAEDLGLGNDFDLADARWRDIRSAERILAPLTEAKEGVQASPEKLQGAWDKLSSAQRQELQLLAKGAGLDTDSLEAQSAVAGKVLKGTKPRYPSWFQRFAYGYLPARVAVGGALGLAGEEGARKRGASGALRSMGFILPMALGYGGVGALMPILERGAAVGAMEDLPAELSRPGYGPATPTTLEPPIYFEEKGGTRWAVAPDGVRVSVRPNTTASEAKQLLDQQRQMQQAIRGRSQ